MEACTTPSPVEGRVDYSGLWLGITCDVGTDASVISPTPSLNQERERQCALLASYPGLPSQLFFAAVELTHAFSHGCKKSCEGRPGYEAS